MFFENYLDGFFCIDIVISLRPIVAIPTTVRQNLLTFIKKGLRYLSYIAHFNTKKKIYIPQKAYRVN